MMTVCVRLQVTNVSKDTRVKWFKDGVELPRVVFESSGVSTFTVPQVHVHTEEKHLERCEGSVLSASQAELTVS